MSEIDPYDGGDEITLADQFVYDPPYDLSEDRVGYRDPLARPHEPLTLPLPPYEYHGRAKINLGKIYLIDGCWAWEIRSARKGLHACFTSQGKRIPGSIDSGNDTLHLQLTARTPMPGRDDLRNALVALQGESPAEWTGRHATDELHPHLVEPYTWNQNLKTPFAWARAQLRHVLGFTVAMHLSHEFPIEHASYPYTKAASVVCNQPSDDMRRVRHYEVSCSEKEFAKYGPDAMYLLLELRDLIPLNQFDASALTMFAEVPRAVDGGLIVTTIPPLVRSLAGAGISPLEALSFALKGSLDIHSQGEEPWWFHEGQDVLPILLLLGKQRGLNDPNTVLCDTETRALFLRIAKLSGHATSECAMLYALSGHRLTAFPGIDDDAAIRCCNAVIRDYGIGNLPRAGRIIEMILSWLEQTEGPDCPALLDACVRHLAAHKPLSPVVASLEGDDAGFPLPGMQLFYSALHPDDDRTKTIDSLNYLPEDFHRLLATLGSEGKAKNAAIQMLALYRRFAERFAHEAYEMTCIYFLYCAKHMKDPWHPSDHLLNVMRTLEYIPVSDDKTDEFREGHQSSHRHFETLGLLLSLQQRGALSQELMHEVLAWMTHAKSMLGDEPTHEMNLLSMRLGVLHRHRSVFQSLMALADAGVLDPSDCSMVCDATLRNIVREHIGDPHDALSQFHSRYTERLPEARRDFSSLLTSGILHRDATRQGFGAVRNPTDVLKMLSDIFAVLESVEMYLESIKCASIPDLTSFDSGTDSMLRKIIADLSGSAIVDPARAEAFFRAAAANIRREKDVCATLSGLFKRTRQRLSLAGMPEELSNATATSLHLGGVLSGAENLRLLLPPHRSGVADFAQSSDTALVTCNNRHFLEAYERSEDDVRKVIHKSRWDSRGLVPVGGKVHVHRPLSPETDTLLQRAFNFPGSTQFRLIDAKGSLCLPPFPSPGEQMLALAALKQMGIFNDNFAELQIALPGQLTPYRCPILGTTILLASHRNPQYDANAFLTTHPTTGRRFLAYDDRMRPVQLPWMPKANGRTDILGRMDICDFALAQLVHTVLIQEQQDDGPFGKLAHNFRNRHAELLQQEGLEDVLKVSWVRTPGKVDLDEEKAQQEHFSAVQRCVRAYTECAERAARTGEPTGIVFDMRALLSDLQRKVDQIQEEYYPATHPEVARLLTL